MAVMMEKNSPCSTFSALVAAGLLTREPACPGGDVYIWLQRTSTPMLVCSRNDASLPTGFLFCNQSLAISISAAENRQVIKVDNQVIMNFTDSNFACGSGGLRTWGVTGANFDNLIVVTT
jgi:hypothetical protein